MRCFSSLIGRCPLPSEDVPSCRWNQVTVHRLTSNLAKLSELRCPVHHRRKFMGFLIRRKILFLEYVGEVLGIRVDVEEPLHLVNPRFAQNLRSGFAMRSPIVSKAQAPAMEAAKLDGCLGSRLAHVVVICASLRNTRCRTHDAKNVEAEIFANVRGLHGQRLTPRRLCRALVMNHCTVARHSDPSSTCADAAFPTSTWEAASSGRKSDPSNLAEDTGVGLRTLPGHGWPSCATSTQPESDAISEMLKSILCATSVSWQGFGHLQITQFLDFFVSFRPGDDRLMRS